MKKIIVIAALLGMILAACAGQSTPISGAPAAEATHAPAAQSTAPVEPSKVPAQPSSTPAEVSSAPAQAEPANDYAEATGAATALGGTVVYKIVPGESSATYEVGETFFNDNRFNLAVGRTPQVSGEVRVDAANPQNSSIGPLEIDISQFQSDSSRRDNIIRDRFLESGRFPLATFTPNGISGLPTSYSPGQELTFQVTGDLIVKETTKPVTFDVTVRLDGDTLSGTAVTTILLSDFGVGPIEIAGMLGTEDQAKLTLAFIARP